MNKKIIAALKIFLLPFVLTNLSRISYAQDKSVPVDINSIQKETESLFGEMSAILNAKAKEFETIQEQFQKENAEKFKMLEATAKTLETENESLTADITSFNAKMSEFETQCANLSSPEIHAKCLEDQAVLVRQNADLEARSKELEGKIQKFNADQETLQKELAQRYVVYLESLRTLKQRMEQTP